MRLLVTGGSGFLGRYVLAAAVRQGHHCVVLARSPAAAVTVAARGATPLAGDLDDTDGLPALFAAARCEALVSLASLGFGHAPAIVAAAANAGLERAVFVSTTAVATALPARTKPGRLAAEEAVCSSGLRWTILRPTMIYGAAGDRNMSRLLALLAAARRVPVLPVPGGCERGLQQPVHAADVAGAVLGCVPLPRAEGRRYDVAGPAPMPFIELLGIAAGVVGSRARFVPMPLAPVVAATRCYERLSRRPLLRAEQWQRLAEDKAFPIDAAIRDLGYAPRPFSDGIRAEAYALGLARAARVRPRSLGRNPVVPVPPP